MNQTGQPRAKRYGCLAIGFLLGLVMAIPLAFWMCLPSLRLIHRWDQPDGVKYGSFEPYSVYVLQGSRNWSDLSLTGDDHRYILFVARSEPTRPDYGLGIEYHFHFDRNSDQLADRIADYRLDWTPEGITLIEPRGYRLFIPKDAFIGGR